ncbi:MAG: hypothetical protein WCT41_03425 [Candidatus Paceibacterota bacterium]
MDLNQSLPNVGLRKSHIASREFQCWGGIVELIKIMNKSRVIL